MKKLSLLIVVLVATCTVALAQPRAIGGRLAYGVGPSYQHSLGEKNMLQADLDILGYWWGIQGTVTYNWIFPITTFNSGNLNWYAGVGAGGGYAWSGWTRGWYNWSKWNNNGWGGYGFVGAAGMIGIECNFNFGLQLSVDWRPLFGPRFYRGGGVGYYLPGLYAGAPGVGIRYKF